MSVLAHPLGRIFTIGILPLLAMVLVGAAGAAGQAPTASAEPPLALVAPLGDTTGDAAAQAGDDAAAGGWTVGIWPLFVADLISTARQYLLVMLVAALLLVAGAILALWRFFSGRPERRRARDPRTRRERIEQALPELENSVSRLRRLARNMREDDMWTEWLEEMPDPRSDESPIEDRLRLVRALGARLDGMRRETSDHRQTISRLLDERQRAGYRTEVLQEAANLAPATSIARLRGVVEELEQQRKSSQSSLEGLQERIDEARQLCNREIANSIMRRFPLGILSVAEELLSRANSAEEVAARREAVEGILDNIYRQYFPAAHRRRR